MWLLNQTAIAEVSDQRLSHKRTYLASRSSLGPVHALAAGAVSSTLADKLAEQLDLRLVQTACELLQLILIHRHTLLALLLSELSGYLLGPKQAPAGTTRISNLIHAAASSSAEIKAISSLLRYLKFAAH